jgi:hypothetical protein
VSSSYPNESSMMRWDFLEYVIEAKIKVNIKQKFITNFSLSDW